jgi:hypothetical protein
MPELFRVSVAAIAEHLVDWAIVEQWFVNGSINDTINGLLS